jgi:transketolase
VPSDGSSTAHLTAAMADVHGISYLRTTREKTPILYAADETFEIGGSKVLRSAPGDEATIVAAGVTVFEALEAADALGAAGHPVRVIDAYSVKPIDVDTLVRAMDETGLLVVVEDHWLEGGLGEAVLSALAHAAALSGRVVRLGVGAMPGSGTPQELREWAGISADQIRARLEGELSLRVERTSSVPRQPRG